MRKSVALIVVAAVVAVVVAAVGAGTALAASSAQVTNSNDAGTGSFRAAIDQANADVSIGQIVFRPGLGAIMLASPVIYTGGQSLDILGNGAVLDGVGLASGDPAAFLASGGGDLSIAKLTVRNAPQQGLGYEVPGTATGIKTVVLHGVTIRGNDGHGVHINDQINGSPASLEVLVIGSSFEDNGFGALDRDGLRVDEGGAGSLNAVIKLTEVNGNGGDGIELDERGDGDAVFDVSGTHLSENGNFNTQVDPDDGMDVDEDGDGSVIGKLMNSSANDNLEEGLDFNENSAGDLRVDMTNVEASRNREEGVDLEEDDDVAGGGDLVTTLIGVTADDNAAGNGGLRIRERGDGNLSATVRGAQANGNQTDGINVTEELAGNLTATIDQSTTVGNTGDGIEFEENGVGDLASTVDHSTADDNQDGIEFDENGDGNLTGTVSRSSSTSNDVGVRADQQAPGAGTLNLLGTAFDGNTIDVVNVNVTVTP